ncbi:hypothetical protein EMIHUDRAFT_196133 [Emiliania huxleyi CCMP1516]|uniref:Uncharacterized protein n=2 Tax=Emiliania huxleyi TaxID=2903 RepID=A0A0D3J3J7_EMIH1|nr:hypothetical protein EMIHUDRAFT_196133 [Emiliania huxleyi CCMP1516]EOD18082.1 hypothetical protein EMIHUDRAFT_196133 [Emiliania huxleyi CCMP1516]|eukprot:XP_005770511.1 hypothetical protein EMIHUDRAFT_196133 [Emiliania huxleyi CCMP1516]
MLADAGWRLESDTWSSRVLRFFGCHSFGEATALGSESVPAAPPVPPPDAPRVLLLDPGSGDACEALQGCFRVYLAVDPSYDIQAAALPRPPHSLSRRTSTSRLVYA